MKPRLTLLLLACSVACGGAHKGASTPGASAPLAEERIHAEKTARPVVEIRLTFEAGSVDDPPGKEGLSALMVATMLEGRAGKLSYAERERALFPMAAEIKGDVEREQIMFSARVHRDHLARFYPLLRDLLRAPAFDVIDFERVRAHLLSALTQDLRGTNDEQLGKEVLEAMLFEHHPYGFPALGTERGLISSTFQDARQHWARTLCAKRVRVALSGALDDAFVATLRADLGALTSEACSAPRTLPSPASPGARRLWIVDKPEAQSVAISLGLPLDVTRAQPEEHAALMLAAAYFGQHRTFAGRLMQKLRADRGLNYGDYAYAEHFAQDGGTRFPRPNVARHQQYFSIWLRPVPVDKAQFALRMAVRELELLVKEGISEQDFARIQRFAPRYFALFAQTEQQRLGNLLDDAFYGIRGPHLPELCTRMARLTRAQVNDALGRHLHPELLQVAMVAPHASELAEAVAADGPSPITYTSEKPKAVLDEDKLIERHPVGIDRANISLVPLAKVFY
jgi:zinc protease